MIKHTQTNITGTAKSCLILIFIISGLTACSIVQVEEPVIQPSTSGKPYLGIVFDDADSGKGVKIIRTLPGPLRETLQQGFNIELNKDRLISIDGKPVTSKTLRPIISEYRPDQKMTLVFEHEYPGGYRQIPVDIILDDETEWTGPVFKASMINADDIRFEYLPEDLIDTQLNNLIKTEISSKGLGTEIDKLHTLFYEWQKKNKGFHSLSRVMFPFQHPDHLTELETTITNPIADLYKQPNIMFNEIAKNLDLKAPAKKSCAATSTDWNTLFESIKTSHSFLKKAFNKIDKTKVQTVEEGFLYLLTELSNMRPPDSQLNPKLSLVAMNSSMNIDYHSLLEAARTFDCFIKKENVLTINSSDKTEQIPYQLKKAISGAIKSAVLIDGRWIVFGSEEDNHYDMSVIDVVYDPGGNDTYQYQKPDPFNLQLVIDKAGNDRYLSNDIGPASGWFGISILIDHAGNDLYQGKIAANGTGMMGIGILIDYAGTDTFNGDHFSNGAAYYGAGLLLDLGNDADIYHSSTFSQGFGGPRGFGLLYDHSGNDLYRANGLTPSVYGTPAVYVSFSQGIGFGLRHYDSGGIGILYDAQGNDRYEGGEFSQAGGYYWGLGILHDEHGDDFYYGNRYSQGFAAHQATGILIDKQGNDNYWGMTAACQGAAWDVAMGLLVDASGNDSYQGDNLCQGSAAMQAMGWLIDMNGVDHYNATGHSVQGRSGNNTYHFTPENPVYSWSLLLDAGGDNDFYSSDAGNNQIYKYSEMNNETPAESLSHGLFIDYPELIKN